MSAVTDAEWELVRPFLPVAAIRRLPRALRAQFNGVVYHFRTGSQWRDLSERYGNWNTVYKRFCAWRDARVFQTMMGGLIASAAARGETDLALVAVAAEERGVTPSQMSDIYRRQLARAARPRRRLTRRVVRSAAVFANGAKPEPPSRSSGAPAAG